MSKNDQNSTSVKVQYYNIAQAYSDRYKSANGGAAPTVFNNDLHEAFLKRACEKAGVEVDPALLGDLVALSNSGAVRNKLVKDGYWSRGGAANAIDVSDL